MAVKLDKEEVISLYNKTGATKKDVTKELRVSTKTLSKFMEENGIETKNNKKSAKTQHKKMYEEKVITFNNNVNAGYQTKKIEKITSEKDNKLNLYIPEKWI